MRIEPTIGRVVWFARGRDQSEPFAAMIAFVHPGGTHVNLRYMDHNADSHKAMNVPLVNYGENPPAEGPCCTWMPYQFGQAAKTQQIAESLEAERREIDSAKRSRRVDASGNLIAEAAADRTGWPADTTKVAPTGTLPTGNEAPGS